MGTYAAAIGNFRAVLDSEGTNVDDQTADLAFLGYAYALADRKNDALSLLNQLQRLRRTQYVSPGLTVKIWIALGKKDKALTLLEEGYRLHSSFLMYLASEPAFAPLYSDDRFQDLLRRIGLPSN